MRCLDPIRLKNPQYPDLSSLKFIDCACGKCINCLINRRHQWYFRLFNESLCSDSTFFLSLDYAPVFCDFNLHKDHLQKFFKRLRKLGVKFRYYAIGEFGTSPEHSHRPHYHALIFTDQVLTRDYFYLLCKSVWHFGHVDVGSMDPAAINYVLHYHVRPKRPFGSDDPRETFCVMSNGLGLSFLDDHLIDLLSMLTHSTKRTVKNSLNQSFILPRYYVKKLKDYGLPVCEFDGSKIDWSRSNLRELVEMLDKSIEFYPDGRVKEKSFERWMSLVNAIFYQSSKNLEKYDCQSKNSF